MMKHTSGREVIKIRNREVYLKEFCGLGKEREVPLFPKINHMPNHIQYLAGM